jgi:hypothetical protein
LSSQDINHCIQPSTTIIAPCNTSIANTTQPSNTITPTTVSFNPSLAPNVITHHKLRSENPKNINHTSLATQWASHTNPKPTVTRSHKLTDRNHAGLANGTAAPEDHLPKYFGKAGYAGESPSNTKKQGGGKGNWYVRSRN